MSGLMLAALLAAMPQEPELDRARVVLKTSKGELVVVLYSQVAPRHVAHFLKCVRAGFYEGTRFNFVQPGNLIQHAGRIDRLRPFTTEQTRLDTVRIPAEFSKLRHERGVLSMAREPDNIDSAGAVFSIMLGDAPTMDGLYTIFGRVEEGFHVLDALEAVPTRPDFVPKLPLNLHHAYVQFENPAMPLIVGTSLMGLGLIGFLLSGRLLPRFAGPIGLSLVIVGFFIGFVVATPVIVEGGEHREVWALIVFVSLLALFKLMNKFESPRPS